MKIIYILIFYILISIEANSQNLDVSKYREIKRTDLIGFGENLGYNPIVKDSLGNLMGEFTLPQNVRDMYLGKAYVDPKHIDIVRLKKDSSSLNGKYKIVQLPLLKRDEVNLSKIESVFAEFNNGKRAGIWFYYLPDIAYIDKTVRKPVKIEIYKDGLPDGVWSVNGPEIEAKYLYNNGVITKEFVKERNNITCYFYNEGVLINKMIFMSDQVIYYIYNNDKNPSTEIINIKDNKVTQQFIKIKDKINEVSEFF